MKSALALSLLLLFSIAVPFQVRAQPPQQQRGGTNQAANPMAVFPKDRLLVPVDESAWVTLPGNIHPLVRAEFDRGPAPVDNPMPRMTLALRRAPEQQAALDALSLTLQDPASPLFHHWLTPQQFGEHFGLSQNDLDRITNWLAAQGFTVDEVPAGHWTIVFSGTVAQVETAFRTTIHNYQFPDGTYFANSSDPQVPEAFAGVISGIVGLNNIRSSPAGRRAAPRALGGNGLYYLDPSDFATIYDLPKGLDGSGVNIAVIENCTMDVSLAQAYWQLEGVSSQGLWYWNFGTPTACTSKESDEVYLDIEWAQAVAQGATVWLVAAGGSDALFDAVQGVVNSGVDNTFAPVITMSYSWGCNSQTYDQSWIDIWQQAHNQGNTGLVASGDWGAAACDSNDPDTQTVATNGAAINDYCQSIYVTCVGGTQFNDVADPSQYWSASGQAQRYIPELAWNETNGTAIWGATGGGYSTFNPKPAWQTGNASAYRGVPDVALTAASHDAYRVCDETSGYPCTSQWIQPLAGTSAAAPTFAGMMALLVQQSGHQGSVNQTLYALAARNDVGLIFHDVTSGNNSVPGQTGYDAGAGWDPVTGLGSVDAANLIANWSSAYAPEVQLSAGSLNFGSEPVGQAGSAQTITVTNYGVAADPSGNLATLTISKVTLGGTNPNDFSGNDTCVSTFAAGSSCRLTVTFQPTAGGTRTASVMIYDNAPNSPQILTLTGTGVGSGPAPQISGLVPPSATAGGAAFTLTVNGSNFAAGAAVLWNGAALTTTFNSSTQLTASVSASLIASGGTANIAVSSGGQTSAPTSFMISPPAGNPGVTLVTDLVSNTTGVVNGSCVTPPSVTSFTTSSAQVWVYFYVTGATVGDSATIDFIRPDGVLYQSYNPTSQFTDICFSYAINISGANAASYPGLWTVKAFWNQSTTPLFSLNFTLTSQNTTNPLPAVGSIAHLASGGTQWTTTITLINPGAAPAQATLNFFDDNGNALPLPLTFPQGYLSPVTTSSFTSTLNAGAALVIQTAGLNNPLSVGWAQLLSNGNIAGFAVFTDALSAQQQQQAVVPMQSPSSASYILWYDNTGGFSTGVALANVSAQSETITVVIRDDAGNALSTQSIALPALGHMSFSLATQFAVTAGRRGTIDFQPPSNGQISVLGLSFNPLSAFTSVPSLAQ